MCIPNSRYGLTLARVTSENSTMLLESDILRLFFTGPYLVSSPLCSVSGVDCPSILPRQLLFCCLPLCSPATNCLCSCPTTNYLSWSPATNFFSLGRVVNSHSPPRTTSGYGEISCPRILCLVSRQNRQLNRLLWQPTPIVLQQQEDLVSMKRLLRAMDFWCWDWQKRIARNLFFSNESVSCIANFYIVLLVFYH